MQPDGRSPSIDHPLPLTTVRVCVTCKRTTAAANVIGRADACIFHELRVDPAVFGEESQDGNVDLAA